MVLITRVISRNLRSHHRRTSAYCCQQASATRYHGTEHEVVTCPRDEFCSAAPRVLLVKRYLRDIYLRRKNFVKNLENRVRHPPGCVRKRVRWRLCESCIRVCICVCVCVCINFVKAFKGIVSSVPYSPRGTFVDRRALFDIHDKTGLSSWLRCKRAQLHGSLWRQKRKKKKEKREEGKRSQNRMTGKRNGCPLVDGDFLRRAWRLNKLRRSSLAIFFSFLR